MQPFVAIDFETANEQRRSACSVAAVRFDNKGEIADKVVALIRPHHSVDYFNPINTWVHGITADDVKEAPEWPQIEPRVREVIGELPIVAHNMAFDGYVLSDLAELYGLEPIANRRFCTVRLARRLLYEVLVSRRLPEVFGHYFPDEPLTNHHEAFSDAYACGRIFARMQRDQDWNTLEELCPPTGSHVSRLNAVSADKRNRARAQDLIAIYGNSDAIEGERIAITGTLQCAQRAAVQELIRSVGAVAEKNLTKKTTMLVVGIPNPRSWSPGASASRKLNMAQKMREEGSPIEVVTEEEFFRRLLD
ncbi:MAG: exonuclease domain-containing protein [Actinomycetaceae bacterium]|nr:exonuclease domain-containing protein [Actinomycetaceae bacterium]